MNFGKAYKKEGLYSPITQNQRHLNVLKEVRREVKTGSFLGLSEKIFDNTNLDKKCTVTVNHVVNGQNYKTETLKGNEGTAYTTSPLSELTDNGYTVTSTGSTSGTFSKAGATVTYTYNIDQSKIGSVTVKYQDMSGTSISSDDTYTGLIGKSYSYQPKSIKGYEYVSTTGNASGTFAKTSSTVIFKYQEVEEDTLKVHYYNASGGSKVCMYAYTESGTVTSQLTGAWPGKAMTKSSDGWYVGEVNTTDSALFIANNKQSRRIGLVHLRGKGLKVCTGSGGCNLYVNAGLFGVGLSELLECLVDFGLEVQPVNLSGSG